MSKPTYEELENRVKELEKAEAECKEAEETLKASIERMGALLDTISHAVYECDTNGRILSANNAFSKITGYSEKEISRKNIWDLMVDGPERDSLPDYLTYLIKDKPAPTPYTAKNLNKDGTITDVHVDWNYSVDKAGQVVGFVCVLSDITERRKAEEALLESEKKLLEAQYISKMGDFTWNIQTGEASWSNGMYRLLKFDIDETIDYAKVNKDIHHPEDLERVTKWLMDSVASGKKELAPYEYRLICKDGEIIEVQTNAKIVYRDGKASKLFGTCINITERKKAEEAFKEREEFYTMLIDSTSDGYFDHNLLTDEVYYGEKCESLLGYAPGEIKHHLSSWQSLLHPEDVPGIGKKVKELVEGKKEQFVHEYRFSNNKEDWRWLLSRAKIVEWDDNGKPTRLVGTHQDITRRKQAENALKDEHALNEQLLNSIPHAAMLINRDRKVVVANKLALEVGTKIGDYCWKEFAQCSCLSEENKRRAEKNPDTKGIKCTFCLADQCLNNDKTSNDPEVFAFDRLWDTYWVPLGDGETYLHYSIDVTERVQAEEEKSKLIIKLEKALDEVKTLRGFIPICAYCKKIRNDDGYWEQIETYISQHSDAKFSHGICEPCAKKLYPEIHPDDK
ncbi:MAG: PAS domain S-box protein [bacterium]|nr:PAS domain S-box protein [bacterium]